MVTPLLRVFSFVFTPPPRVLCSLFSGKLVRVTLRFIGSGVREGRDTIGSATGQVCGANKGRRPATQHPRTSVVLVSFD